MRRECLLEGGILARAYASYTCMCSFLYLSELRAAANTLGKRKYELEREGSIGRERLKTDGN